MKIESLLCALDGSGSAEKGLELAIDLAKAHRARLVLVHVLLRDANEEELRRFAEAEGLTEARAPEAERLQSVDARLETGLTFPHESPSTETLMKIGESILASAERKARSTGIESVHTALAEGAPAHRIVECARREAVDCIVMGSRGLSDAAAVFLGSTSHGVSNRAPCTCITVR